MPQPRDSQVRKVFAAQRAIPATRFGHGGEATRFAKKIVSSRWGGSHFKPRPVDVHFEQSSSCAATLQRTGILMLPGSASTDVDVCHAVAHVLLPATSERAWHSPAFCLLLAEMVGRFVSPEAETALREGYKTNKVKIRTVSPEAREAARQRYKDRQSLTAEDEMLAQLERMATNLRTEDSA